MVRRLIYRPWLDAIGAPFVSRVYLPISVGWSAARTADGDPDRFAEASGIEIPHTLLRSILWRHRLAGRAYAGARERWERDFFAPMPPTPARLLRTHRLHLLAAANWLGRRSVFLPWARTLPAARWDIASPEVVGAAHAGRLADPGAAYAPPERTAVHPTHPLRRGAAQVYWMRFASPILGDTAWARIIEPVATRPRQTLIVLHGIFAEPGLWPERTDPFESLVNAGMRVVRLTAPWHGRRMLASRYSGEPVLALGPAGLLTLFHAWIAEVTLIIDWAQQQGSATVALAGISLGALTAQILATAAHSWPEHLRPQALLLVATTGVLTDIVYGGSLATGTGLADHLDQAGWSAALMDRWSALLEPGPTPVMGPDRVLLVIGEEDDLTPMPGGRLLAERWAIPRANLFLRPQGHFSLSLGLAAQPEPIRRLLHLMQA